MTLRDLTPRQLYNLRRRSKKEKREYHTAVQRQQTTATEWDSAYSKGLKAGLELGYTKGEKDSMLNHSA